MCVFWVGVEELIMWHLFQHVTVMPRRTEGSNVSRVVMYFHSVESVQNYITHICYWSSSIYILSVPLINIATLYCWVITLLVGCLINFGINCFLLQEHMCHLQQPLGFFLATDEVFVLCKHIIFSLKSIQLACKQPISGCLRYCMVCVHSLCDVILLAEHFLYVPVLAFCSICLFICFICCILSLFNCTKLPSWLLGWFTAYLVTYPQWTVGLNGCLPIWLTG